MSIVVLSRSIRSGKTSELMKWVENSTNVAGVLMPDVDGKRCFFDIQSHTFYEAETLEHEDEKGKCYSIGKFLFLKSAFKKANQQVLNAHIQNKNWIVVDEVGKLELLEKSFHDSLKILCPLFLNQNHESRLLLVIREDLLKSILEFYGIDQYTLVQSTSEIQK